MRDDGVQGEVGVSPPFAEAEVSEDYISEAGSEGVSEFAVCFGAVASWRTSRSRSHSGSHFSSDEDPTTPLQSGPPTSPPDCPFSCLCIHAGVAARSINLATTEQCVRGLVCWGAGGSRWKAQPVASVEREGDGSLPTC